MNDEFHAEDPGIGPGKCPRSSQRTAWYLPTAGAVGRLWETDPPPGRPKADQPPRGATTRAAVECGGFSAPSAPGSPG
ncbi:hypothetical protein F3K02_25315 [Hydrogenophaga sp. D2P1]|uniref:Uncharacterized protein n=1 Tax=Hydrogenophaga aromaticivorans TaxID=2610898 RepID=A0A7Y8H1U7_9BURK|nr:hypothetical protein [Hydrogenophaga aromaticivorans]